NGCIDAMCLAVGDFDHNRFQDLFITNVGPGHYLYLNQGDGTFINGAHAAGVDSMTVGWGSVFFDYNNDGWEDLYVCQDPVINLLYKNLGGSMAVDVAAQMGVADASSSYTCAVADIDNDGDLDLAVSNRPNSDTPGSIRLYVNYEGQRRHWVKFKVIG